MQEISTQRLIARKPRPADLRGLSAICSDGRLWSHRPSSRHTSTEQTGSMMQRWMSGWEADGLGMRVVCTRDSPEIIGYGGCTLVGADYWNLGYRFAVEAQGRGYAAEIAQAAVAEAQKTNADIPVVASLLEHNSASAAVAQKLGMKLAYRGFDKGNPDPSAVRLVYSDRVLCFEQLSRIIAPAR